MSTPAQQFAEHYRALPQDFRDRHPRPVSNLDHTLVSAWLNGIHKGVEVTCTNLLRIATHATACGDLGGALAALDEAAPFRAVMADLDALAQRGRAA